MMLIFFCRLGELDLAVHGVFMTTVSIYYIFPLAVAGKAALHKLPTLVFVSAFHSVHVLCSYVLCESQELRRQSRVDSWAAARWRLLVKLCCLACSQTRLGALGRDSCWSFSCGTSIELITALLHSVFCHVCCGFPIL